MRTMKHWALAAMAATALALAGCGGGGSSSSGGPSEPAPVPVSLAGVTAGGEGYMAPMPTGDTPIQIEAGMSETSGSVTFMCAAGGDACTVMVAADGSVTSTGGMVTAMNSSSYQTALDEAAAAKVAAATKAAGTKRTAIEAEAAQTDDAGLGGSDAPAAGSTGAYTLAIKHGETSITVEGATDADDEKFVQAMDLGGGSTMHTRTMDADTDGNVMTEVAIVTTDIEAPKATAFGMVHTLDVRVDGETATDEMPNDALNVATANLAHVKASMFTAPAGTVGTTILSFQHEVGDDATTMDTDESKAAAEIMGTYEGAMGVYKCNASSACTVTVDGKGMVSAVSNNDDWIFIPADGATVDVADTDYLHYGFWLKRTTDSDGAVTYNEVETFAGSSIDQSSALDRVTGKATYDGGATGVYVRETYKTSDGSVDTATSGHFMADASLTAYFGQTVDDPDTAGVNEAGRIPPAMLNSLSGTIDNFVLSGGEANDWSVNLAQGDVNADGTASGVANGGGDAGTWGATFHGPTADDTQPHSVVGEFNANFGNGTVAGAFGARKQ